MKGRFERFCCILALHNNLVESHVSGQVTDLGRFSQIDCKISKRMNLLYCSEHKLIKAIVKCTKENHSSEELWPFPVFMLKVICGLDRITQATKPLSTKHARHQYVHHIIIIIITSQSNRQLVISHKYKTLPHTLKATIIIALIWWTLSLTS